MLDPLCAIKTWLRCFVQYSAHFNPFTSRRKSMPKQTLKQMVHIFIVITFILCLGGQAAPARAQEPAAIVVNSTGDDPDVGFGRPCETATGNGVCTLRAAIKVANDLQSMHGTVITFDIEHSIPTTPTIINVLTALPGLMVPGTTIQGPNLHDGSVLVLDGNQGAYHGLEIRANNCAIKKLTIANFGNYGISVWPPTGDPVTGLLITGNKIGNMVPLGIIDKPNGGGIKLWNTASSVIGGDTNADRNVIAGNTGYGIYILDSATNVVRGNYIGVKDDGLTALPNSSGVYVSNSTGNTIGGSTAGRRNVISGNTSNGVYVVGNENVVMGNYVGTDISGTVAIPNGNIGVRIGNGGEAVSSGNIIGGSAAGQGNLISGNGSYGIQAVVSDLTTIQGNTIGLDASKTAAIPNLFGISLSSALNNFIGGTVAGAGNVIAGNTRQGIFVAEGCINTSVRGNFIGVNSLGQAFGNGMDGIKVQFASDTNIGGIDDPYENIIAHNGGNGIELESAYAKVMGNKIYENAELGIDALRQTNQQGVTPNDPDESDNIQNFPIIKKVSFPSPGKV
jgi:CSLREA domain-containing protein